MNIEKLKKSNKLALRAILNTLPTIIGVLLLVSIITNTISESFYKSLFNGSLWRDSLIGDVLGSLSIGNPVTGYILGDELLRNGVSLIAVTSFLVAWVTVGFIQLPAEMAILGKRFSIFRNISAFFMALIVAVLTVLIVGVIKI